MRDFKGMKRQRSRNRNPGGGGGNKPQQHNANRAFDSNGPEGVKVRGAAQSVYEKYQQLARDAQTSGDRVLAENYLQHAEHYFRLLRAMQPLRPLSEIIGRDQFVSGYDIDFEDESALEAAEAAEAQQPDVQTEGIDGRSENRQNDFRQNDSRQTDNRQNENRQNDNRRDDRYQGERGGYERNTTDRTDRYQGDRQQGDRYQGDRQQGDRYQGGQDRQQGDRPRNDRNRDDRGPRSYRDDRPRYDRDDRPREDRPRDERPREERPQVAERVEAEPTYAAAATPEPDMRLAEPAPVLRAGDGDVSAAPAFLQARPASAEGGEEVRRPRRRRAPASFEPAPEVSANAPADE